jgi:hypothetical protein
VLSIITTPGDVMTDRWGTSKVGHYQPFAKQTEGPLKAEAV